MFHRLMPTHQIKKDDPYALRGTLISTNRFEDVISKYLDNGFSFVTISELVSGSFRNCVALTFDDGYLDNFLYALPTLEKYRLKATFYPIIGYCLSQKLAPLDYYYDYIKNNIAPINKAEWVMGKFKQEFLKLSIKDQYKFTLSLKIERQPDVKYMTSTQLIALGSKGHEVGAHSLYHNIYTNLSEDDVATDIANTLKSFQSIGLNPKSFAYPDGQYNEQVIKQIEKGGFKSACTIKSENITKDSHFELERKFVTEDEII